MKNGENQCEMKWKKAKISESESGVAANMKTGEMYRKPHGENENEIKKENESRKSKKENEKRNEMKESEKWNENINGGGVAAKAAKIEMKGGNWRRAMAWKRINNEIMAKAKEERKWKLMAKAAKSENIESGENGVSGNNGVEMKMSIMACINNKINGEMASMARHSRNNKSAAKRNQWNESRRHKWNGNERKMAKIESEESEMKGEKRKWLKYRQRNGG